MQKANDMVVNNCRQLNKAVISAIAQCTPQMLDIDTLVDRAERGEWGGLWW
ncbi:MAG: hypothetical protein AAGA08_13430 [Pseudomonadota bacterium]